mgnify:CR=1 FL=1
MKAFGGIEPLQYVSFREFGGINAQTPFQNGQSNLIAGSGLCLDYFPVIKSRRPISIGTSIAISPSSTAPMSMSSFNNFKCYTYSNKFVGERSGTPVTATLSNSNEVSFTTYKGNLGNSYLIFSNGTDLKKFDGTTVSDLLPGGYAVTVNGYFITTHKNRLFCTSNKTTTILFSALNKADDWATANDAGSIEIDDVSDKNITAIYSAGDRLLIFRENSFYELIGTGTTNFRIVQVSKEIGALNNRSVVSLNGIIYFAHSTGLYSYSSGSNPILVSTPVNNFFQFEYMNSSYNTDIKNYTVVLTDNKYIYYNPLSYNGLQQLYQYDPIHNQWVGFYEKNIQAGALVNSTFYLMERVSTTQYRINTVSNRSDESFSGADRWFVYLPLINGETTMSSINIRSLHLRTSFSESFDIYVLGQTKGGYQYGFPFFLQTNYFPMNDTNGIIQYAQKVFSSSTLADGYTNYPLDRGIKIPIKPNNKYTGVSVIIIGTGQFTLNEIALEFMNMPFNNNSTVGALV